MDFDVAEAFSKSRLKSLLDHLGRVDDVREPWRVAHPLMARDSLHCGSKRKLY